MVPMINIVNTLTMAHAATRKSHKLRLQLSNSFSKILAQSVSLVGIVREQRYHVECHSSILLASHHQSAVYSLVAIHLCALLVCGIQRKSISLPLLAYYLQLTLSHHVAIFSNQCHAEFLFLARDVASIDREIVCRTTVYDAIPSLVIQGIGSNHGIMRIVLAQRIFGSYSDRSIALPCCYGTPSLMVVACIFEVAILHKFGIESAIGSIADIFEKHTNKLIRNSLALSGIHIELCLHHLWQ